MANSLLENLSAAAALSGSDLFYVKQGGARGLKATGTQLLALVGTTYVPLAGGVTMTGALTLPAGAVGTPSLMLTGAGSNTGIFSAGSNNVAVAINGTNVLSVGSSSVGFTGQVQFVNNGGSIRLGSGGTGDPYIFRVENYRIGIIDNAAVGAIALSLYPFYNGGSNYERLTLTGVAGTSVNITAETLGTGGDNLDIVLTPAGTGSVKFPGSSSVRSDGYFFGNGILCATETALNYYEVGVRFASTGLVSWTSGVVAGTKDTALARNAAGIVEVNNGTAGTWRDLKLRNLIQTEYHELTEMTAPAAPATNGVRIFAQDNGAGKTQLMVQFATGAAQEIKIEA